MPRFSQHTYGSIISECIYGSSKKDHHHHYGSSAAFVLFRSRNKVAQAGKSDNPRMNQVTFFFFSLLFSVCSLSAVHPWTHLFLIKTNDLLKTWIFFRSVVFLKKNRSPKSDISSMLRFFNINSSKCILFRPRIQERMLLYLQIRFRNGFPLMGLLSLAGLLLVVLCWPFVSWPCRLIHLFVIQSPQHWYHWKTLLPFFLQNIYNVLTHKCREIKTNP